MTRCWYEVNSLHMCPSMGLRSLAWLTPHIPLISQMVDLDFAEENCSETIRTPKILSLFFTQFLSARSKPTQKTTLKCSSNPIFK